MPGPDPKYYVDATGRYLGAFSGALPPAGAVEIPGPPEDGRQMWRAGKWTAPRLSWADVRRERDRMLAESDWRVLPDAPGNREAWLAYRKALRDISKGTTDPTRVNWPAVPTD